jgi:hypothetical protein
VLGLHQTLAVIVLVAGAITLILGLVCIVLSRRSATAHADAANSALANSALANSALATPLRIFRYALWATAGIGVLQAIVGGILFLQGDRPGEGLHFVYGIIVLGAVPVAYVYSDQKDVRRDIIIMAIAAAAVVGAAIRAFATGPA